MNRIDQLKQNYQRLCEYSWDHRVAGAQRVWIAVYDKEDERKLRRRLGLFEEATRHRGREWAAIDLTDSFPAWMLGPTNVGYAESYFESPESLDSAVLAGMTTTVVARIRTEMAALPNPENTVVALYGVAGLFGFVRMSEILSKVEDHVKGRLLVLFPGTLEHNNYRLLDARDGWNYHAFPILASDPEIRA